MWNLEKWYRRTSLQSSSRDTDIEDNHIDTGGGMGGWDELGDWDGHKHITVYKIDN